MKKVLLSLMCIVALVGCASTQEITIQHGAETKNTPALFANVFEGNWIGELQPIGSANVPFTAQESTITIRLRIRQGQAELFYLKDTDWSPNYPTRYALDIKGPNAIIFMQSLAPDIFAKSGFGGWAESRVLLLTKKDDDAVYISMQRAVSNYLKKPDEENSRFFMLFVGELKRDANLANK